MIDATLLPLTELHNHVPAPPLVLTEKRRPGAPARAAPGSMRRAGERRVPRKIRYTEAEWAAVVCRARECRKAPASYVREVSLGAIPKTRRGRESGEVVRELGRIGMTLREIATVLRGSDQAVRRNDLVSEIEGALGELLDTVRRIG